MDKLALSQETLKQLLDYDPNTGLFTWRKRDRSWFTSDHQERAVNAGLIGRKAGCVAKTHGYIAIRILNKLYLAHRLAWFYIYGEWPLEVDHLNRDRTDNRLSNLREVTRVINSQNHPKRRDNTSGHTGVSWHSGTNKWRAYITAINGKTRYLGLFAEVKDAIAVRKSAESEYGFHPQHGGASK